MIDYDKLRIAHKLCLKNGYSFSCFFGGKDITGYFEQELIGDNYIIYDIEAGPILDEYENIDDLIAKLQELTQKEEPKAKYKVGEFLYFINTNEPEWKIESSSVTCYPKPDGNNGFEYEFEGWTIHENYLYPTKQALIETQIEYWQSLHNHSEDKLEKVECQHESDGDKFYSARPEFLPGQINKCKKCGEFYR